MTITTIVGRFSELKRRDAGKKGFRTGGIQEKRDKGLQGFRKEEIPDWRDTGKEGLGTTGIQY